MLSEREVELFLAIAEKRNISRAAESLHITQPALSRSLHRLEASLHTDLFDRSTTPLSLTQAGYRYLSYAERYMSLLTPMREEFSSETVKEQGAISIGIPSQIANYIFPQAISFFQEKYPDITVRMKYGTSEQLAGLLKNGRLHCAVLRSPPLLKSFSHCFLAYDKVLLAIPANYRTDQYLVSGPEDIPYVEFDKIAGLQFFVTETFFHSSVRALLDAVGITPGQIIYVPSMHVAWEFARKGAGIAFILQSMVRHMPAIQGPAYCAIDAPESTIRFTLTYRESTLANNRILQMFVSHCKKSFLGGGI